MEMETVGTGVIMGFLPQILEPKNEGLFEITPAADNIVAMTLQCNMDKKIMKTKYPLYPYV